MSSLDPAKLKVVDLRSELSSRGLDSKGNKAALVKRLKDALEQELNQDIPDTSIADTSTEDFDTSLVDEKVKETPKREKDKPPTEELTKLDETKSNKTAEKPKVPSPEPSDNPSDKPKTDVKSPEKQNAITKTDSESSENASEIKEKTESNETIIPIQEETDSSASKEDKEQKSEENGEHVEQTEEKTHKSRWNEEEVVIESDLTQTESKEQDAEAGTSKPEGEPEHKGEKRRRSSASPERSQRRRSRSPVKEDEPTIDNDKVQLSWYDSDLHLQLDKESFLSAKPLTEGAFGYAWAGVRGTHGVSSGKVCYEVKLIEELKWDDFSKYDQRGGRDRYRTDHRKNQKRDKDKKDGDNKSTEKSKNENGEDKDEKSPEKKDSSGEGKDDSAEQEEKDVTGGDEEKDVTAGDGEEKMDESVTETQESEKATETPMETDEKQEGDEKPIEADAASSEDKKEDDSTSKSKDDEASAEESKKDANSEQSEPIPSHLCRVGWSVVASSLQLGEEKFSYGYESSAKFVTDNQFVDYGIKFGVGDVVGAYIDINEEDVKITYTVNGEIQPVATTVPRADFPEEDFALFPHVLSRNYAFEINLGDREEPWFPIPDELPEYGYLSKNEDNVAGPMRPENRGECEVILMCGLPGAGKTHWVKEHVVSNLDKKYTVLGNTNLLEKMTVSGEPLKSKFKGRWSMLVDRIQKSLNKLISIASLRRRNYIIDQTNVFPSAQRRKMRPFEGFKRRAVIVVVEDEEQARRQSLQEAQDGKDVPDSTILEMKAAMALPEKGDWLEEVTYAGLEEAEAKELVKKYNTAGKEAGYGSDKRFGRRDDRWQNRRNDYRGKSYRERSYQTQRYDPRGPRQGGWSNQRSGGGNWNRDRRDSRGPPNRDWRGSGRDGGNRGSRGQSGNYNRNRGQGSGGSRGNWTGWGNQQGWNQQTFGGGGGTSGYSGGSQGWGNWKYNQGGQGQGGGGQGYGNYQNWSYYGQGYPQNWNSQGQHTNSSAGASSGNSSANSQYAQGYNTQEAWAQFARQYAQQSAAAQNQAAQGTKK